MVRMLEEQGRALSNFWSQCFLRSSLSFVAKVTRDRVKGAVSLSISTSFHVANLGNQCLAPFISHQESELKQTVSLFLQTLHHCRSEM